MKLSQSARVVYDSRYHVDDETPETMLNRVARTLAGVEMDAKWIKTAEEYEAVRSQFYKMMDEQRALPNSPTLYNAGRDSGQLSACFVLPVEDSLSSIFMTLHNAVIIQHTGGGVGYSFSKIRPGGSAVMSSRGIAGGPVCFIKIYDQALMPIKQGGRRPGANMATLSISHPDILDFIRCKSVEGDITNFNISVEISDDFIQAVKEKRNWSLIDPRTGAVVHEMPAHDLMMEIANNAWRNGEPGVIFLERMNSVNPTPLSPYPSVNPCGEQPLPAYEACNLGSVNLSNHVVEDASGRRFDWDALDETIRTLVRMLDDVIEGSKFPIKEVAHNVSRHRRIGLGVMGWADALIKMGIPYCSYEATDLARTVMKFVQDAADSASVGLAYERGNFPAFADSVYGPEHSKMRNATRTTIAPTGSISILADCSSGIEPVYAFKYDRFVMTPHGNQQFEMKHPLYAEAEANGEIDSRVFIDAERVPWEWHVAHQAAFQKYCDNGVSKTINMPHSATVNDIFNAVLRAHEMGLKGFTVYRTGSRSLQVLDARTECPDCKQKAVVTEENCQKCTSCGWSACGYQSGVSESEFSSGVQSTHDVAPGKAG